MASSSALALHLLRRLLCAHSSADGPAAAPGHVAEPEHETTPRSPCIVARLMGLDAMPGAETPLRRSRSASAEGSPGPRAVVQASASLRERPAYLRRESDEFLLLSFSPDGHRGRDVREELEFLLAAAGGEEGVDGGAGGQRRRRSNGHRRRLRFGADDAEAGSGRRVFRRRRVPAAAECDAQSASPVSVLEARDEASTTSTSSSPYSVEEVEHAEPCCSATSVTVDQAHTTLEQQNSRRKLLHADFDQNFQLDNLTPARSSCHVSRCSDSRERRNKRVVNRAEVVTPDVAGIWQPICRLVEEDLKNMEWPTGDGAVAVAEIESARSISKKQLCGKNFLQTRGAIGCY
ncbi:hypothetical protein BS78_09G028700 [Paspalum vaginatum]|nr:hypothetical protein BS78_09G028700 [Paspalum vaginatum]